MNIALWIVQALLAFAFLAAGGMKLATPVDQLAEQMAWVASVPSFVPKVIGLLEVLGAVGLILPSALRIQPQLTPLAAGGLVLTMLGAIGTHVALGELAQTPPGIVLGALAAFVAWGRAGQVTIEPK